ncbi:MAG: hypothetical protein ACRC8S_14675 [Fimbriiglobus sp.]
MNRRDMVRELIPFLYPDRVLLTQADYGPESAEWVECLRGCVSTLAAFAAGESVSRFRLDLCAESARCCATAMANVAQMMGQSVGHEAAEFTIAAIAFTADCARAKTPEKAANLAERVRQLAAG